MSQQTIERPDVDQRPDDGSTSDGPDRFHYVKKDRILKSVVDGDHVVALCGETFPVTKTARPGSPVCQDCKRVYDRLRAT